MEFNSVISTRRSIRKYKSDPFPDSYLEQLIEAARLAPSGLNVQPWRYIIVKDGEMRKKIAGTTPSAFVAEAPAVIICCINKNAILSMKERATELINIGALPASREYWSFTENISMDEVSIKINLYLNAGISIEHILLKATDLGLGTCWVGSFDAQAIKKLVGIGENYDISAMIAVGYPDQSPSARPRLPMSEVLLKTI